MIVESRSSLARRPVMSYQHDAFLASQSLLPQIAILYFDEHGKNNSGLLRRFSLSYLILGHPTMV